MSLFVKRLSECFSISYKNKIESKFKRYIVFGIISLIYSLINRFHLNDSRLLNSFIEKDMKKDINFTSFMEISEKHIC